MHGLIFVELQKLVEEKLGKEQWPALLNKAGLAPRTYLAGQKYPDAEAVALVTTASKLTGKPAGALLEAFGEFIVPDLLTVYKSLIQPQWSVLDILEQTPVTIHSVVQMRDHNAAPPAIIVTRPRPDEVLITYSSARKMCAVAKGIIKGIAKHKDEAVSIDETECMLRGAQACLITVKQT
jgi:hypothetical protein